MRHGIAGDAPPGMSDADRTLTLQGRRRMARIARGLRFIGVKPAIILTSPLERARQTAEILGAGLRCSAALEELGALAPGGSPAEILGSLARYRHRGDLMLVGHEPLLGYTASQIQTGSAPLISMPFKKGGVAAFQLASLGAAARGELRWFLTPKQLRLLGCLGGVG